MDFVEFKSQLFDQLKAAGVINGLKVSLLLAFPLRLGNIIHVLSHCTRASPVPSC